MLLRQYRCIDPHHNSHQRPFSNLRYEWMAESTSADSPPSDSYTETAFNFFQHSQHTFRQSLYDIISTTWEGLQWGSSQDLRGNRIKVEIGITNCKEQQSRGVKECSIKAAKGPWGLQYVIKRISQWSETTESIRSQPGSHRILSS